MSAATQATTAALGVAFKAAYGDDFDVALATGLARCDAKDWSADAGNEVTDFVAVVLASAIVGREGAENHADVDKLLARTVVVLAQKDGWKPNDPQPKGSGAESNLILILGAIVIVAEVAAFAYVVYRASQVVQSVLVNYEAARELMRAHSDAMHVVDEHRKAEEKAGHVIAYDTGEKTILERLQQAQDNALKISLATTNASTGSAVPEVGAGVILGLAAAAALAYVVLAPKR